MNKSSVFVRLRNACFPIELKAKGVPTSSKEGVGETQDSGPGAVTGCCCRVLLQAAAAAAGRVLLQVAVGGCCCMLQAEKATRTTERMKATTSSETREFILGATRCERPQREKTRQG